VRRALAAPLLATVLLIAAAAASAPAAEIEAGYSGLRESGTLVHGVVLGLRGRSGTALRLGVEATAQSGTSAGEHVRELGLLAGAELAPWHGGRVSPFLSAKAGAVGTSRHLEVFGVSISPTGVCGGSCGYDVGPAAEGGAGLDLRLSERWTLRLGEVDYRLRRISGVTDHDLRVSAGLVLR